MQTAETTLTEKNLYALSLVVVASGNSSYTMDYGKIEADTVDFRDGSIVFIKDGQIIAAIPSMLGIVIKV